MAVSSDSPPKPWEFMPGTLESISSGFLAFTFSRSCSVKRLTATGVSLTFSLTLDALTTTSSSSCLTSAARTGAANKRIEAKEMNLFTNDLLISK